MSKRRVTISVDADLLAVGEAAVAQGRAPSLSAWVNLALADRAAAELRLQAWDDYLADHEAEHGAITDEEIEAQLAADRDAAAAVRARAPKRHSAA